MTNNSQEQRLLPVAQQFRKKTAWGVALGIMFLGAFLSAPAQAATFTVNTNVDFADADPGDGVCDIAPPTKACTLRAAVMEANHARGGPHTISIPPGIYTLTEPSFGGDSETAGALKITAGVSIIGAGASASIIDANGSVTHDRGVFILAGIAVNVTGVTIRNGAPTLGGGGFPLIAGGIMNWGTLTLVNSTVSGNTTIDAVDDGGGIFNLSIGTLTLINSTVSGNTAGRVATSSGPAFFEAAKGGGIFNEGILTMINSTVSGNRANGNGGGIWNVGTANLFNATITNNQADADLNGTGVGGGVFHTGVRTFNFQNTIIAGNRETRFDLALGRVSTFRDCAGTLTSFGNNLMRNDDNCTVNGSAPTVTIPMLGPLQNNGGPTQTHAPLAGSPAIDAGNPAGCRDLFGALLTTDQRGVSRPALGCDIGAFELQASTGLVSAVLPSSRSVQVNTPATAFATVINSGSTTATSCGITLLTNIPVIGFFQTTNPLTNQLTGTANTPVDIPAGAAQSFVVAFTPTQAFASTDAQMIFDCTNTDPAPIHTGLNTLLLSASATAVPDIVALAATTTNDGILNIPGTNGTGAFAVATVNVGVSGSITASADTGSASLPVSIFLCQTNPGTGQCISVIGPTVTTTINANATPTFGIFVQGNVNVPFDPAVNRIFVRFKDGGGVTRGSTSVAVRTQ